MVLANGNIRSSVDQRALHPATYKYDAFGRRIEKVDSKASKTRRYYYDNRLRVLEEYDNAPAPARQAYFVWGNYIDELLLVNDDADDDADYYACRDHLYSVHVLYNPTTGIAERYDYDAYGQPTIYTDDGDDNTWFTSDDTTANDSTIENAYTFTGRRLDTLDSGDFTIMYYRARYYSPATGRFTAHDPIGHRRGANLYQYVTSNPIAWLDPSGLIETKFGGGKGVYAGFGWSVDVEVKKTKEDCCKNGRLIYGGYKKWEVTGSVHVGIGVGGHFTFMGYHVGLEYRGPGATGKISGACSSDCGEELGCCQACAAIGLTWANNFSAGKGPLKGTVRLEVNGEFRACYNSPKCPKPGWAIGWCGSAVVNFEWTALWWGDTYDLVDMKGCKAIIGDDDMLAPI